MSSGVGAAAHAAAEDDRQGDAGQCVGGEQDRRRALQPLGLDLRQRRERRLRGQRPVDHLLDEAVEPRDRVQVDCSRSYPERVAALPGDRPERDVGQGRRRRDLGLPVAEGARQSLEAVLELGGRVARRRARRARTEAETPSARPAPGVVPPLRAS
jgi:hypothetical protein